MYKITKNEFNVYLNTDKDVEEFLFVHFPDTVIKVDDIEMTVEDFNIKYKSLQYQRDRLEQYPSIGEQLDMIYHNIENWKNVISTIKEEYPKPTEVI